MKKEEYRIRTFEDIVRALRERPDWLDEVRRLVLTEELFQLPGKVDQLAGRFEKKMQTIDEDVKKLSGDVKRLDENVEKLNKDVKRLDEDVKRLKEDVKKLKEDVAELKGDNFERKVRERAPGYFGRLIRRCRVVGIEDLADLLEDAVEGGVIREEEKEEALQTDLVVRGRLKRSGEEVVLIVEVPMKVDREDIERAWRRAEIFGKVFHLTSLAVAVGKESTEDAERTAQALGVFLV